jgi:hypothetical protein
VSDREQEVTRKERGLVKKKEHLDQREEVITTFHKKLKAYNMMLEKQRDKQAAAEAKMQKLQQELDDKASNIARAEESLKAKMPPWRNELLISPGRRRTSPLGRRCGKGGTSCWSSLSSRQRRKRSDWRGKSGHWRSWPAGSRRGRLLRRRRRPWAPRRWR